MSVPQQKIEGFLNGDRLQQVEPLKRGHEVRMRPQNGNQLLVNAAQRFSFCPSPLELPAPNRVSDQPCENNDGEADRQSRGDIAPMD
jgi:hypothetical protein